MDDVSWFTRASVTGTVKDRPDQGIPTMTPNLALPQCCFSWGIPSRGQLWESQGSRLLGCRELVPGVFRARVGPRNSQGSPYERDIFNTA